MRQTLCTRCRPLAGLIRRQAIRYSATRQQRRNESTIASDVSPDVSPDVLTDLLADVSTDDSTDEQGEIANERKPRVIFSGIQPTGVPHLGNYLGALKPWKKLQDDAEPEDKLFFSVVDLHAITMPQDASSLRLRRREMLASLLAVGLDPDKGSTIFFQSSVPQHTELMWILSCTASMGYLGRMTQWKSKLQIKNKAVDLDEAAMKNLKLGLFSYPVLQAADILVHRATHVPVGDDQRQHLEFARECATNFNHTFKKILVPPETMTSPYPRIMSLSNPECKMSKSTPNWRSRISITAPPAEIRTRIKSAVTDNLGPVTYDPESRPGVSNLLRLLSQCSSSSSQEELRHLPPEELARQLEGASLKELKELVTEAVCGELRGMKERHSEFLNRKGGKWLDELEAEGAEVARRNAEETMRMVRDAVGLGLGPPPI